MESHGETLDLGNSRKINFNGKRRQKRIGKTLSALGENQGRFLPSPRKVRGQAQCSAFPGSARGRSVPGSSREPAGRAGELLGCAAQRLLMVSLLLPSAGLRAEEGSQKRRAWPPEGIQTSSF